MEDICTIDTHSAQTQGKKYKLDCTLTILIAADFCQIFYNLGCWPDNIKTHQDVDELSFINLLWRFYIKNITDTINHLDTSDLRWQLV